MCGILFKLIADRNKNICLLSAELLFDIYTTKSIDSNNTSQDTSKTRMMWQLATMMDKSSLLEEMLLRKPLNEKELMEELCMTNDGSFSAMEKDVFYKCGKYAEV